MRLPVWHNAPKMPKVSIHASVKDATLAVMYGYSLCPVSIHASVKDATLPISRVVVPRLVSIHASVKDATRRVCQLLLLLNCFNPRICKRCDPGSADTLIYVEVSIHASVKDATTFMLSMIFSPGFNPRICKRCDTKHNRIKHEIKFQSTHL